MGLKMADFQGAYDPTVQPEQPGRIVFSKSVTQHEIANTKTGLPRLKGCRVGFKDSLGRCVLYIALDFVLKP